jgi:dipeptidyl aminopeptidase/acylaminoacyl peptidase
MGLAARPRPLAVAAIVVASCSKTEPGPPPTPAASFEASAGSTSAASASAPALDADAATTTPLGREVDALFALHRFPEVALSPSGTRVAWVESYDVPGTETTTSIVRATDRKAPSAEPRMLTAGGAARVEHDIAWSPDGKCVAFVSDAPGRDRAQLYLARFDDAQSPPRKMTQLEGAISSPRFSPDGKTIAVLFAEKAARVGAVEAVEPMQGEVEEHSPVQRIALVDVESGSVKTLSRADLYVHELAWSPDGTRFAAVAAPPPGDRHWWVARLYVVDATSGSDRAVYAPPRQIAEPRWSPDGKSIAFIGGLMSDEGATGGDVYVVSADAGPASQARDVTPGLHGSATDLAWPQANRIVFAAIVDGGAAIEAVDPAGAVQLLWSGPEESLHAIGFSSTGTLSAVARESFAHATEIAAGDIGAWQPLTHVNEAHTPASSAARLSWKSEGRDVQGWLVSPPRADPSKRMPLAVFVHGGPASAFTPSTGIHELFAEHGYYVLMPNPRGSFGQGEDFTEANVKDLGHGDMRDILAGVDQVLRTAPVDPARVMLFGWSYGGYMTMWMVTQTGRFRAAVAGAGIADWRSYWGQNAIADWMLPYFGATVYDDPKVYARSSPIEFVKQARTPTLLLVGERDGECPAAQSQQFWRALQAQGVETRLVVYPGEGHRLRKPAHRRDRVVRILDWFDRHS